MPAARGSRANTVFPRRARLSRAAFPAALARGRRLASPHFSAVVPREGWGYAVVVPKKVAKSSVTRHRIKRRVLGALRVLAAPPALILYPRLSVARMPLAELRAELSALLSQAGATT